MEAASVVSIFACANCKFATLRIARMAILSVEPSLIFFYVPPCILKTVFMLKPDLCPKSK